MEFLDKSFVFAKTYVFVDILVRMIVSSDRGRPEEVRRHGIKLRKPVCEILFHKSLVEIASIFKFKMATAEKKISIRLR